MQIQLNHKSAVAAVLAGCLSAAGISLPTRSLAGHPTTTLVVDAAKTLTESDNGDDLATIKNIFQGANSPQDGNTGGGSDPRRGIISDLKMKRMRILQGDTYCDLDANGNLGNRPLPDVRGNYPAVVPGDCDLIKWQIDWALTSGLSPHVALGSTLPVSFAQKYGPAETWHKQNLGNGRTPLDLYKSYVNQLIRYIASRAFNGGASSVTVEVSNELDIAEDAPINYPSPRPDQWTLRQLGPWGRFLWWIDPASYQLAQWPGNDPAPTSKPTWYPYIVDFRRVDRAVAPMQKIIADAIQALRDDPTFQARYPGKTVQLAGPAFAGSSAQYINYFAPAVRYTLEEWFLDEMLDPKVVDPSTGKVAPYHISSLDLFSFHYYGDFRNGVTAVPPSDPKYNVARQPTTLKNTVSRIRAKLASLGHPETKLFISEWGPRADDNEINYSHQGAAWTAAFLMEALANHVSMGSYLVLDDAVGNNPGDVGIPSLLYRDPGGKYYPKPPANVMKMFAMMTGVRRAVTLPTATPLLGAFAATDTRSAGVLAFNYDYDYSFTDTPQSFSVELDHLPFNGLVTVERYLVDANTSNLKAYLTQPTRPDPSLQKVEQFTTQVIGGQLILPPRTLGLGVTYWRILG